MHEAYHRALMAFPDEDVVVGSRFVAADALEAFKELDEVTPSPGSRAVGEERAWGRRLAKRFGVEQAYDEKTFVVTANGQSAASSTSSRPSRRRSTPPTTAMFAPIPADGGVAGRLRLDDGRGSRQARQSLTADGRVRRRRAPPTDDPGVRRPTRSPPGCSSTLVDLAVARAERRQDPGLAPGRAARASETARFWDITLPAMRRGTFKWQRLLDAPVIALPLADPRPTSTATPSPTRPAPASAPVPRRGRRRTGRSTARWR